MTAVELAVEPAEVKAATEAEGSLRWSGPLLSVTVKAILQSYQGLAAVVAEVSVVRAHAVAVHHSRLVIGGSLDEAAIRSSRYFEHNFLELMIRRLVFAPFEQAQ